MPSRCLALPSGNVELLCSQFVVDKTVLGNKRRSGDVLNFKVDNVLGKIKSGGQSRLNYYAGGAS